MKPSSQIRLVPWDPSSTDQQGRLYEHRVRCGWDQEKVKPTWCNEQIKGTKCLFWIALSADDPDFEEKLNLHLDIYPEDNVPLKDTCLALRGTPITPSQDAFYPIGHISLDTAHAAVEGLDLDLPENGVYWIKSFWVSEALRSKGIGRAAMDAVEGMAAASPLCAKVLALDTLHKEDQTREDVMRAFFGGFVKMANHEWYERRGYRLIKTVRCFYKNADKEGKTYDTRTVFMVKDVV